MGCQTFQTRHHCDLYTDHEALKSLLNTPQPSPAECLMLNREMYFSLVSGATGQKLSTCADSSGWLRSKVSFITAWC